MEHEPHAAGLTLHEGDDVEALAAAFVRRVIVPGDPFDRPLVLVPGAGVSRWLSQRVATLAAGDGQGVAAGLDVHRVDAFEALLTGRRRGDDAWSPERLVWQVLRLADAGADDRLAPLIRHLAATDQRYANALRVTGLLARYADHRPELLRSWSADPGAAESLGVDAWQAHLWRRLREELACPDPVTRRAALAEAISSGEHPLAWPAVHLFAPRRISPAQADLVRACAARVPVSVWLPISGPQVTGNALAAALGLRGAAERRRWRGLADAVVEVPGRTPAGTLLGSVQADVLAGVGVRRVVARVGIGDGPVDDDTVQVHASHGPARQVEVLREVLTGLFADDPSLEPRDVVIACPDPAELAPHLAAVFGAGEPTDGGPAPWSHPGTGLRVQVAEADAATANRLHALLGDLLTLGASRATAGQLLALAAHPFVARRFGFGADDLERLEELVDAAAIRWGINPEHRRWFGVGGIQQNTWQLGVQRLVMGEAFSDDELVAAGVVATVDDVTSTDATLIGGLAELVSRVTRAVRLCAQPATAAEWADRLAGFLDDVADVPFEESWQLAQMWSALEGLRSRGEGSAAPLGRHDAVALLDASFADRRTRPAFGNGSLVVCDLAALSLVPHRIVCLVGLDERTFPRRELGDGDDLLASCPQPGDPDPGLDDRQLLLDALLSARDRLVVVYQGHSSLTHEPYPPPAGVVDLLEALAAAGAAERPEDVVRPASLQSFSPRNFQPASPRSFDLAALGAARALTSPRQPPLERYEVGHLHDPDPPETLELRALQELLRHPARYLLRSRANLTLAGDEPPPTEIPLELGGLEQWEIGSRVLEGLRAGHSPDALRTATWLSGEIPPHRLGARVLDGILDKAVGIHEQFVEVADHQVESHVVDVRAAGVRVTGRLVTRAGRVATSQFSRPDARHAATAWLEVLALTLQLERRMEGVVVGGNSQRLRLVGPPVDVAARLLGDLVDLARSGRERILPMPPRVAQHWAMARARGTDPTSEDATLKELWKRERDDAWALYFPPNRRPWDLPRGDDPWGHPEERNQLGALAAIAWAPIVRAST